MYLKEIYLENTGPISKCHVDLPFDDNGNPLPVVIVGPNGSGKSIFLSYIVDALTEFAKVAFDDIVPTDGLSTPYFRVIHPRAIRSGRLFSLSLLRFKANDDDLYYCEKSGGLDPATYSPSVKSVFDRIWKWPEDGNHKDVSVNKKTVETEMQNGSHAFFPAGRREDPDWLNPKSLGIGMNSSANRRFNNELDKPLWIETCAEENISWILDVFLDSSFDLDGLQKLQKIAITLQEQRTLPQESMAMLHRQIFSRTRANVESILRAILQDKAAELILNYRNIVSSRISIKMSDGQIVPTFQSLSAGQSQLFHTFATIIRYGERTNLNRSVDLSQITGLVVIDEIAAHLHPTLQHDVLPKLIKLFPKVQFIVSSHSPLFLLGMEKEFGTDGLTILELPDGNRINSERFSEFRKAFEYYQDTESFEGEIKQLIMKIAKPTVLTEGKLDAYYIRKALDLLGEEDLLDTLEIRTVGEEKDGGTRYGGKDGLDRVLNFHRKDSSLINQPILLLYDWDTDKAAGQVGNLWVRLIPKNVEDTEGKKGIENLFPLHLFKDCFYDERPKKGVHGRNKIEPVFRKTEFCQWICEERKNVDDFANFGVVVGILKEFVRAHQSHLN